MKSPQARAIAALLITAALAGCGGKNSYPASGTINNLRTNGLVLANNGDTVSPVAGASSFTFPTQVSYGESYNIVVQTQPAHMTCAVSSGGSGSGGQYLSINAVVSCSQSVHAVGGTISGLTVAGLVLANGTDQLSPVVGATTFAMPLSVADGSFYGVSVYTQPAGLTCSVASATATGTMGQADIANITVSCVPATT